MNGAVWTLLADLIPAAAVLALLASLVADLVRTHREEADLLNKIFMFAPAGKPEAKKEEAEDE